jgi:hypothetical protein
MASSGRGSKIKGKEYERWVANQLNIVFGYQARRTPSSGAIQDRFPGDIMDLGCPLDRFIIECKKQEKISIWEWLKQAEKSAQIVNKIPLLIFSRNNSKSYVTISLTEFMDIMKELRDVHC